MVRLLPRLLVAALAAGLPAGLAAVSCGTGAVGTDACRTIELARCQAAPACTPGFDTNRCEIFYRDECLVGIQNAEGGVSTSQATAQACVDAIHAAVACVDGGGSAACGALIPSVPCNEAAGATATACNVILDCPEVLAACKFVATPPDAAASPTTGADAGDAAAE